MKDNGLGPLMKFGAGLVLALIFPPSLIVSALLLLLLRSSKNK